MVRSRLSATARLMTVSGVGPITGLTFRSSIEDPDNNNSL